MGGRGSGGGRSGGGAANNTPRLISANDYYKEKYSQMNDAELNKAYKNAQRNMQNENAKLQMEINKLKKINEDFAKASENDSDYQAKVDAMNKQIERVNDARTRAGLRETAFYLAVNEKNNVRGRQTAADISKMTNGQLNSFHYKSAKESNKANRRAENAKTKKTHAKNLEKATKHAKDFFKADAERKRRNLGIDDDAKNW